MNRLIATTTHMMDSPMNSARSDFGYATPYQLLYRYADPLFVAAESIQRHIEDCRLSPTALLSLQRSQWFNLLLTTRALLAHTGINDTGEVLFNTVLCNIRGLILLCGIDISTKHTYRRLQGGQTVWFRTELAFGGSRRLQLRSGADDSSILSALTPAAWSTVHNEFIEQESEMAQLFKTAVFRLVATRDSAWEQIARLQMC